MSNTTAIAELIEGAEIGNLHSYEGSLATENPFNPSTDTVYYIDEFDIVSMDTYVDHETTNTNLGMAKGLYAKLVKINEANR